MKMLLEKSMLEALELFKEEIEEIIYELDEALDDLNYVADKDNDEFYREKVLEDAIKRIKVAKGKLKVQ